MVNKYGMDSPRDEYDCFRENDVFMNTADGSIIGHLKDITNTNYILSPFSDTRIDDDGKIEAFLSEKERHYKKIHVRGMRGTTRQSIENFIMSNNKSSLKK